MYFGSHDGGTIFVLCGSGAAIMRISEKYIMNAFPVHYAQRTFGSISDNLL